MHSPDCASLGASRLNSDLLLAEGAATVSSDSLNRIIQVALINAKLNANKEGLHTDEDDDAQAHLVPNRMKAHV